jgi:hypothetical protein
VTQLAAAQTPNPASDPRIDPQVRSFLAELNKEQQAHSGQPILRPDALTFGLFGAWALVTAIGGWKSVNLASAASTPGTI